jgi:hypothetical protein
MVNHDYTKETWLPNCPNFPIDQSSIVVHAPDWKPPDSLPDYIDADSAKFAQLIQSYLLYGKQKQSHTESKQSAPDLDVN